MAPPDAVNVVSEPMSLYVPLVCELAEMVMVLPPAE